MPPRLRKFIGTIALLILVVVWALVAMALAQMPAIRDNAIASVAYYLIAGLGWCLPAIPIVTWMSRKATKQYVGSITACPRENGDPAWITAFAELSDRSIMPPQHSGSRSTSPSPSRKEVRARNGVADIHR